MSKSRLSRREFVGALGGTVAAFTVVPRHAVAGTTANPPSDRLNIAGIGAGGMGGGDIGAVAGGNNIVALCDVNANTLKDATTPRTKQSKDGKTEEVPAKYPKAKLYADFRKMFDEMEKDIDAVTIGIPDHTHAVVAMAAIKRGKHVYCEKPLAHSVHEVRELMKAAKEKNVVTQLGNQGHSSETIRMFCEWIWDGAIGNVQRIELGCAAVNSGVDRLEQVRKERPEVPSHLNWDLWLGPALDRPYHPAYCPGAWRGWTPFGNGTVGDWVCHVVDPVFWALDLGAPKSIQAEVKDWDYKTQGDAFPKGDKITYEFAAKGQRGPITMVWHSGTVKVPRPKELEPDRKHYETGAVVYGDKGVIVYGSHGAGGVRIIPETAMKAYKLPEKKIPRVPGHHGDWLQAIRQGKKAGSDFALYGGPLTEIAMLGVIAIKLHGAKLEWDAEKVQFTNSSEANALINPPYRKGWAL
ncbi:MAG TPA: Gfo/Idh/MocA family oxidoreductase [Planctomycetota bacterium]|nr:Gfo/Idh/MocA family oxidoreductase [Planctomycetota bacterium]HRR79668.1 Gfo/Idh/MocA family oxidoreductase [Planctomycetota bacterium]HRT93676.1 Gfo/Idh/MocA family oxidoreductase [Planctomycetota bacterium]